MRHKLVVVLTFQIVVLSLAAPSRLAPLPTKAFIPAVGKRINLGRGPGQGIDRIEVREGDAEQVAGAVEPDIGQDVPCIVDVAHRRSGEVNRADIAGGVVDPQHDIGPCCDGRKKGAGDASAATLRM